jgi:dipeptide transport system substrate-binding protein
MDYAFWGFNTEKKPFDDQRVRLALSLAINKDAIMQTIFRGELGVPAGGVVPPGLLGHDPSIKPYPYDVDRAKKLLVEAGLPNGFKTEIWAMPVVRAYMPNARRTAEMMQQNLAGIGVTAEIKSVEWAEYLRRTIAGEHETVILGWNYAVADPGQILNLGWTCAAAKNGLNRSRWCNPKFDDAVASAALVADPAQRTRYYQDAQKIFYDDVAAMLIAYAAKIALISPKVEGFKIAPVGPQFFVGVRIAN